jgi:TRAP-type C4-dicarboxylate transport system permease small subunit
VADDPAHVPGALPLDSPPAARTLNRLNAALGTLEVAILALCTIALVGVAAYFALASKLLGRQETWPFEVIRYMVFFVAMAGGALAAQRQGMFNMDLLTRRLSGRTRAVLRIATALLVATLCLLVVRSGFDLRANAAAMTEDHEVISEGVAVLALIGGFGLIALHVLLHAAVDAAFLAAGRIPPDPPQGGH